MIGEAISHYRILSKLGAGGMGEVYLAEDTQLDRRVAIKVLPAESVADEQARRRLVREARAAAKLDHPNICSIHEVGESQGQSFNKDQAFAWLEKDFQDKSGQLDFVKMEVSFDPLRSDPRYADLLRRMGLKP